MSVDAPDPRPGPSDGAARSRVGSKRVRALPRADLRAPAFRRPRQAHAAPAGVAALDGRAGVGLHRRGRLGAFSGGESEFRAFVFTIAYRRLTDELRRRSRRGEHEEWQQELDDRRAPSAEHEAISRLSDDATLAMLDGLSPDQRDVMVLRIIGDLTVEQVAHVLGKRPGAVKALQRRALETLRRKLSRGRTPLGGRGDGRE